MTGATTGDTDEATLPLPWRVLDDYHCFGCSPHNPCGLGLRFWPHPDGVVTHFTLGRTHESYPGVVHGGLLGVVCDETMGNLIVLRTGLVAFTVGMRVRYLEPVVVGAGYSCVASLSARDDGDGEPVAARAEITDAGGALVATATATYRRVDLAGSRDRISLDDGQLRLLEDALAENGTDHHPVDTRGGSR